jgi:hypothetical protein
MEFIKVMVTIAYRPMGFAVVTTMESGCKFNAGYYLSKMLTLLSEWWCDGGRGNLGNLISMPMRFVSTKPQFRRSSWPGTRWQSQPIRPSHRI